MGNNHKLLLVLVATLVVLAGCASMGGGDGAVAGGDGGGDGGDGSAAPRDNSDGGNRASSGQGSQSAITAQPLQANRAIIRTGQLTLEVDDFETARSRLANHARSLGGYVGGSGSTHNTKGNQSWKTGYVVLRVPSEKFSDMLSFARKRGTVLSEETTTKDVTDKLVDLEARLANLDSRRSRLRSFYDRAETTEELIRIEKRLSKVQGQIEQLKAKKRALEDRVSYATLRVKINEPTPGSTPTPTPENASSASLVSAFASSAQTVLDLVYGFVLFTVRIAPYVLFLGVPALVTTTIARRRYDIEMPFVEKPPSSTATSPSGTRSPDDESHRPTQALPTDDESDEISESQGDEPSDEDTEVTDATGEDAEDVVTAESEPTDDENDP